MATVYLMDTNILVALIRDNALGREILARFNLRAFLTKCMISVVTVGEIEKLARDFGWENDKLSAMRNLLHQLIWIDINEPAIFDAYAEIDCYSDSRGILMGKNDVWIAATAQCIGSTLLTTDRDFDHLDPEFLTRVWIDPNAAKAT